MDNLIRKIKQDINSNQQQKAKGATSFNVARVAIDDKGHSKFDITKEQLEYLSKYGFTAPMMSEVLGVSESTIHRRLREFSIQLRKVTTITEADLDEKTKEVARDNRLIGPNSIRARLAEKNIFVTRQRVRDSCMRVDPAGCALRSLERKNVVRRTYHVAGPNSLWHIDGNHKLIRWGIVIHGCIDGFSRMITFLKASNNNKSITVFDNFIDATKEFGLPSRIRCDQGGENSDVCTYMDGLRGANRGSAIKGKSCHNQRIERLWVDVWENVTNEFYDLFSYMEFENILDVTKAEQMFALHFVFLPRINERLKSFIFQYNNHPLSTEHNKKPVQLFIQGVLMNSTSNISVRELVHQAGNNNTEVINNFQEYGVDLEFDEEVELGEAEVGQENTLNVDSPISEDELGLLRQEIDPLMQKSVTVYGVQLFQKVKEFVRRFTN